MLVTEMLKLAPSPQQAELLATMRACNAAATRAADVAFRHQTANKLRLHSLCYPSLRDEFGLSAQMAIRAIAKACEAYKRDKTIQPVFRPAFYQLRQFIAYKAKLAGVPVVLVDPRNTSRECPGCGHIDKANRPRQGWFACQRCGLAGPADHIAARIIAGRAAVMQPDAA